MGGVDLDLFQFDWDMTWAAFFLNADGTIYGRYGSRHALREGSDDLLSLPSLANAMRRALVVHAGYPKNKEALAAKRGPPQRWKRPEDIPELPDHAKRARPPRTCIHCHHVPVGIRRSLIVEKTLLSDNEIWIYPYPENIGITIDVGHGSRVEKVRAGSPAARAGVATGDVVETMNGQPIGSIADIQWVLHTAPTKTRIAVEVTRRGKREQLEIALEGAWKETDISWRISTWVMRPGLRLDDITDAERKRMGIAQNGLALRIRRIARNHPNRQRGFKRGDVIIEAGPRKDRMTESQFVAFLRQNYKAGSKLRVKLVRKGRTERHLIRVG